MCSTCNHNEYVETEKIVYSRVIKYLRADDRRTSIDINCDTEGKNYKIGDFLIYRCPTCGRKLF